MMSKIIDFGKVSKRILINNEFKMRVVFNRLQFIFYFYIAVHSMITATICKLS